MMQGGFFGTIKLFIQIFAYFAAYSLGKMQERPKAQWPKAKPGQNPFMAGDWAAYQKIYWGVIAVAILILLVGQSGMGFGGMMSGGYGSGGYY